MTCWRKKNKRELGKIMKVIAKADMLEEVEKEKIG